MFRILCMIFFSFHVLIAGEVHHFAGKHFLASYLDCNIDALYDEYGLIEAMERAVKASGATILDQTSYIFSPHGLTIVFLLSESHASLHAYPEHKACFVDLFTCGEACSSKPFDEVLRAYLQPQRVTQRIFLRSEVFEEVASEAVD